MGILWNRFSILLKRGRGKIMSEFIKSTITEFDKISDGEIKTEELIMNEKERFGRVRTSMMKHLRSKYGDDVANRALSRINKRVSQGSLRVKDHLKFVEAK